MTVLTLINDFINTGYLYLKFLVILRHYITLFTSGELNTSLECKYISIINQLEYTPYIIFPTTLQLSYAKVIYTAQAPVINFRLSNNRKQIHKKFQSPMTELDHDVTFHGVKTHKWTSDLAYLEYYLKMAPYPGFSNIIKKLKPHISNTNGNTTEHYNNQLLTYIIFQVIHEYGNIEDLTSKEKLTNKLAEMQKIRRSNLFLEDKNLKAAVLYAYKKQTKQDLSENNITELNNNSLTLSGHRYHNGKVAIPLINYILQTFGDLFISLSDPSPVAQTVNTHTQVQEAQTTKSLQEQSPHSGSTAEVPIEVELSSSSSLLYNNAGNPLNNITLPKPVQNATLLDTTTGAAEKSHKPLEAALATQKPHTPNIQASTKAVIEAKDAARDKATQKADKREADRLRKEALKASKELSARNQEYTRRQAESLKAGKELANPTPNNSNESTPLAIYRGTKQACESAEKVYDQALTFNIGEHINIKDAISECINLAKDFSKTAFIFVTEATEATKTNKSKNITDKDVKNIIDLVEEAVVFADAANEAEINNTLKTFKQTFYNKLLKNKTNAIDRAIFYKQKSADNTFNSNKKSSNFDSILYLQLATAYFYASASFIYLLNIFSPKGNQYINTAHTKHNYLKTSGGGTRSKSKVSHKKYKLLSRKHHKRTIKRLNKKQKTNKNIAY